MSTIKWADLTTKQREHLKLACEGINPKNEKIDQLTLDALKDMGLVHKTTNRKGRTVWRTTDTGRGLVASRGLLPTFLHRRSQYGYTSSYHQAMKGEPEVMPDAA
jgi:hypothetical protein